MKEKKRDVKGWIAIGLAVLSLFLVVFGPTLKKQYEEAKEKQAAAEAEKKRQEEEQEKKQKEQEKQELFESFFSPEEGWTLADYDQALTETVIYYLNENVKDIGYALDTEEELQSLKFYDCYVVNNESYLSKEDNFGYDLAVRYTLRFDGNDEDSGFTLFFDMDDKLYRNFDNSDRFHMNDAGDFIDYITSNWESIHYGRSLFSEAWGKRQMARTTNSLICLTAEDFATLMEKLAAEEH